MIHALLAAALAATLPAGATLSVDAAASTVRYNVTHKLHKVHGESRQIEGKAVVADGRVLGMVRVPVSSFRSGDGNRDAHMEEALEAGKFPFVVWKGVAKLGSGNALPDGPLQMEGQLELHGVTRPVSALLTIEVRADGAVHARGSLDVDLDAHGVERPALLFVKIDDTCRIDVDLVLRERKP
jgi:polyisoprenoid-binding protein YceI